MKKGPSNARISRGISIVNASVAGREKNVKKVISFPYSCNKDILGFAVFSNGHCYCDA